MTTESVLLTSYNAADIIENVSAVIDDLYNSSTDRGFSAAQLQAFREQNEYRNRLTHYLMGIGGSTVCCLGTIANALSVAVLTRQAMRSSTYMYLAALAICDSLVLLFTLLLILKDTRPPDNAHQLEQVHAVLFPFVHPTAIVFQVTSIWLTLAFTVDRYIMICHPFSAERMCRRSRARKVIVGIYIGGLLFNIPRYLEYYTESNNFSLENSTQVYTMYGVAPTDLSENEVFRVLVHSWFYLICVCGIPFLTLVVLNGFLIRAVHLSRRKGKELNAKEKHRNDTTIMLIGVIIIFLICQGPALVSRMMYAFNPGMTKNLRHFTLNEVGSFLVNLNSAINIVPYYLFGRKFRSEFWRIFCNCLFDKDELRRIVRSYSNSMDHRRMSQYNGMELNGVNHRVGVHPSPKNIVRDRTDNWCRNNTLTTSLAERGLLASQHNGNDAYIQLQNGNSAQALNRSETCESVAIPLIHEPPVQQNLYANNGKENMAGKSTTTMSEPSQSSRDSIKDLFSSRSPSTIPLSPHSGSNKNGHVHYMTVATGPLLRDNDWSAV